MSICPFMKNSLAEASPAKILYAANMAARTPRSICPFTKNRLWRDRTAIIL